MAVECLCSGKRREVICRRLQSATGSGASPSLCCSITRHLIAVTSEGHLAACFGCAAACHALRHTME